MNMAFDFCIFFTLSPILNDENALLARICLKNIQITQQTKDGETCGKFVPIEYDILTLEFLSQPCTFWDNQNNQQIGDEKINFDRFY